MNEQNELEALKSENQQLRKRIRDLKATMISQAPMVLGLFLMQYARVWGVISCILSLILYYVLKQAPLENLNLGPTGKKKKRSYRQVKQGLIIAIIALLVFIALPHLLMFVDLGELNQFISVWVYFGWCIFPLVAILMIVLLSVIIAEKTGN